MQQSVVTTSFTAQGNMEDYTPARTASIATVVAGAAGVSPSAVTVRISPASVRISIDIAMPDTATAAATAAALSAPNSPQGIFASATSLSNALVSGGLGPMQIEEIAAAPAVEVHAIAAMPQPPSSPSPLTPPPPPPPTPSTPPPTAPPSPLPPPPPLAPPPPVAPPKQPPTSPPPPSTPPAFPDYTYPATVGPGVVPLPSSEAGVLYTLSLVTIATGTGPPLARSHDGHPWDELGDRRVRVVPAAQGSDGAPTVVLPPMAEGSGRAYLLERYDASESTATRHALADRVAARLLMQATFGGTPSTLRNLSTAISTDGSAAAIGSWLHEQMAMPLSSHREHYRRRVNPRLDPAWRTPWMERHPACSPGSLWRRYAFTERDVSRTLSVSALPGSVHGYRMAVDGVERTDVTQPRGPTTGVIDAVANYTILNDGDCIGVYSHITSLDECTAAAIALQQTWDAPWNFPGVNSNGATPMARDDGTGAPPLRNARSGPRGCYLSGNPPRFFNNGTNWANIRWLFFNANGTNTGKCKSWDHCICKRVPITGSSVGGGPLGGASALPPTAPPAAPPPLAPGVVPNVTDPSQCEASQCCVVLYKQVRGRNCGPVPIWNMAAWAHPGGGTVRSTSLCGRVRYSWLDRSTSHGSCDASQNCDPEADEWSRPLTGGAVRVGTYTDPAAECASNAYTICQVAEGINGRIKLVHVGASCATSNVERFWVLNPPLELSSPRHSLYGATHLAVDAANIALQPMPNAGFADMHTLERLDASCELSAVESFTHLEVRNAGAASTWYALDRRVGFRGNTADEPCTGINTSAPLSYDGSADACPSAVRSPMNAAGCKHSSDARAPRFAATPFQLNETVLRAYYEHAGVLAYRIQGLRLESNYYAISPCAPGISRWWRVAPLPCAAAAEAGPDTALDGGTRESIAAAMAASGDSNEYIRDIDVLTTLATRNNGTCHAQLNGVSAMGAHLTIDGSCWRHVQRNEGNVYSFSYWATYHSGNDQFPDTDNPIDRWALAGHTHIEFPRSHMMGTAGNRQWYKVVDLKMNTEGGVFLQYIGRYGDVVDFAALPPAAQPREMASYLGARALPNTGASLHAGVQVCGSPGEVASDPLLGHHYKCLISGQEQSDHSRLIPHGGTSGKQMVWTTVVLQAPDQLRQRVAFALSQILVIGEEGIGKGDEHEPWVNYYDIFVRHAFGNYRDVLWQVAHSPMMSRYLTFHNNRAKHIAGTNPDENFAREIMQVPKSRLQLSISFLASYR